MNGDIGIVEALCLAVLYKREIVTIDGSCCTVMQFNVPFLSFDIHNIDIIPLLIKEGIKTLS